MQNAPVGTWTRLVSLVAVLLLGLTACGGGEAGETAPAETDPPAAEETATEADAEATPEATENATEEETEAAAFETEELNFSVTVATELMLPTLVATAGGHLEDQGIDPTFMPGSSQNARTALIAGEAQVALVGFNHVPLARGGGEDLKALVAMHEREIFSLVARSGLEGEVEEVADLAGRTVGYGSPGSASWALGVAYLREAGLDPERDVDFVAMGVGADPQVMYSVLESGQADAFVTWEPTTARVLADDVAFPLVPIWEPEVHEQFLGSDRTLSMIAMVREDWAAENPEIADRVYEAHRAALAQIRESEPQEIIDLVMSDPRSAELIGGMEESLFLDILERVHGGYGDGCLDPDLFQIQMDTAVEYEMVEEAITFDEFAVESSVC